MRCQALSCICRDTRPFFRHQSLSGCRHIQPAPCLFECWLPQAQISGLRMFRAGVLVLSLYCSYIQGFSHKSLCICRACATICAHAGHRLLCLKLLLLSRLSCHSSICFLLPSLSLACPLSAAAALVCRM